jgi:hypothetical protein
MIPLCEGSDGQEENPPFAVAAAILRPLSDRAKSVQCRQPRNQSDLFAILKAEWEKNSHFSAE